MGFEGLFIKSADSDLIRHVGEASSTLTVFSLVSIPNFEDTHHPLDTALQLVFVHVDGMYVKLLVLFPPRNIPVDYVHTNPYMREHGH